jgi:pyrimidine-nucleoside phosphorylase
MTRMDAPLGSAIGNAIETREALEILHGRGPADLLECTLLLGAEMLVLGGKAPDVDAAANELHRAIASGAAARVMEKMVEAQHGDPRVVADPSLLAPAPVTCEVKAERAGFVADADALELGLSAVQMGAGRSRADQAIDPGVGIDIVKKPGDEVRAGDVVARLYLRSASAANGLASRVAQAFTYADAPPPARPLVLGRIT